ncbi:MAG TPA: GDSL-type esterase/lipase family protein [Candidatus Omnitrophota bacterium]|nr:GDSL-type esterase/lipase family protein [Candidatus Omnitrophota bacterium]
MIKKYLSLFICVIFLCGCEPRIANRDSQGTTVVCFGDSLTEGFGAEKGKDYPSVLRSKVNLPVINTGISGNTTGDALARLENDVSAHDPRIVIITLGANDFFRKIPKEETLKNMEAIIDRIHGKGAMVVWATVQTGLLGDDYQEDFKKLAHQKHIVLIPHILKGILFDPRYKYDQIHPNGKGYEIMAERIYQRVKPLLK